MNSSAGNECWEGNHIWNVDVVEADRNCVQFRFNEALQWLGGLMVDLLQIVRVQAMVMFLGKTLYSYSASLHPGAWMATDEFNAGGSPAVDLHLRGLEISNTPSHLMLKKLR